MIRHTLKINELWTVEVTGEDNKDALREASFYTELPTECELCGAPMLPDSRKVKAKSGPHAGEIFEYFTLTCASRQHEFALSARKADGALYPKGPFRDRQIGVENNDEGQAVYGYAEDESQQDKRPAPNTDPLAKGERIDITEFLGAMRAKGWAIMEIKSEYKRLFGGPIQDFTAVTPSQAQVLLKLPAPEAIK